MGNLFGVRRRAPTVTAQDRAILQLKQQRDKIKIYQKKTELEMTKNADLALNLFRNGMKDRAIIVLRRKKIMEDVLNRTDKQLATLESLVADIEYTQIEVSVVEGLKVGTEALKQLTKLMDIDGIQQMMDDNEEAAEKQREISAILSQTSERYDESDILNELEKYQEEAAARLLDKLPSIPDEVSSKLVEPISEETSNVQDPDEQANNESGFTPGAIKDDEKTEEKKRNKKKDREYEEESTRREKLTA